MKDLIKSNILNFPHFCSNIPTKPAYGVYISRLIRIGRICDSFKDFADRHYTLLLLLLFYRIHASIVVYANI